MFILIADDEKMLRLSLQSMLEELYPNEHIYIHASNGEAAVTQVRKLPPDIAFLDIKMPLMNGLEALDRCRKISPSTKWVILSGYADFEYAQQAILMLLVWLATLPVLPFTAPLRAFRLTFRTLRLSTRAALS